MPILIFAERKKGLEAEAKRNSKYLLVGEK
jgi:hypothetical protein